MSNSYYKLPSEPVGGVGGENAIELQQAGSGWNCPTCTLRNSEAAAQCEACNTARMAVPVVPVSPQVVVAVPQQVSHLVPVPRAQYAPEPQPQAQQAQPQEPQLEAPEPSPRQQFLRSLNRRRFKQSSAIKHAYRFYKSHCCMLSGVCCMWFLVFLMLFGIIALQIYGIVHDHPKWVEQIKKFHHDHEHGHHHHGFNVVIDTTYEPFATDMICDGTPVFTGEASTKAECEDLCTLMASCNFYAFNVDSNADGVCVTFESCDQITPKPESIVHHKIGSNSPVTPKSTPIQPTATTLPAATEVTTKATTKVTKVTTEQAKNKTQTIDKTFPQVIVSDPANDPTTVSPESTTSGAAINNTTAAINNTTVDDIEWKAMYHELTAGDKARIAYILVIFIFMGLIAGPIKASFFAAIFEGLRNNSQIKFKDFFQCFWCPYWCRLLGLVLVQTCIIAIGFNVFFVPGLVATFLFMWAIPLHKEHRFLGVWGSLYSSSRAVISNADYTFGFLVLSILLNFVGLVTVVGLLFTLPLTAVIYCLYYHNIVGINGLEELPMAYAGASVAQTPNPAVSATPAAYAYPLEPQVARV